MVWKRSVGGINTGNTLRRRYFRGCRKSHFVQHGIFKILLNEAIPEEGWEGTCSLVEEYVPDGGMRESTIDSCVMHSMNKKKRWRIPYLVRRAIWDEEVQQEDFRLVLYERSLLPNVGNEDRWTTSRMARDRADCIGYYDSKTEPTDFHPAKTCARVEDLREKASNPSKGYVKFKRKKPFENQRFQQGIQRKYWLNPDCLSATDARSEDASSDDDGNDIDSLPEVRYEVTEPRQYTSQKHYQPEKKYNLRWKYYYGEQKERTPKTSRKRKGCRSKSWADEYFTGYDRNEIQSEIWRVRDQTDRYKNKLMKLKNNVFNVAGDTIVQSENTSDIRSSISKDDTRNKTEDSRTSVSTASSTNKATDSRTPPSKEGSSNLATKSRTSSSDSRQEEKRDLPKSRTSSQGNGAISKKGSSASTRIKLKQGAKSIPKSPVLKKTEDKYLHIPVFREDLTEYKLLCYYNRKIRLANSGPMRFLVHLKQTSVINNSNGRITCRLLCVKEVSPLLASWWHQGEVPSSTLRVTVQTNVMTDIQIEDVIEGVLEDLKRRNNQVFHLRDVIAVAEARISDTFSRSVSEQTITTETPSSPLCASQQLSTYGLDADDDDEMDSTTETGTVKPAGEKFDDEKACLTLRKAMKGLGTDEKKIINVLASHCNNERQMIKQKYKTMYGKDLVDDLISELSGDFEKLVLYLMMPSRLFDAVVLRRAMEGAGTDERTLIEILCSSNNMEIQETKEQYKLHYKRDLEKDLDSETSGDLKRLLISLVQANRSEEQGIDQAKVHQDAMDLREAGVKQMGTDESVFNRILVARSIGHLRAVLAEYQKLDGQHLEKAIESEMSGDFKTGLLAIVQCIRDPLYYFAECFNSTMVGAGTDDERLMQLVVSHCEVDLKDIGEAYLIKYHVSLPRAIADDTSGDYRKLLVRLANASS